MLRSLAIATAIAFGSVIAAPVFAQAAAQGAATEQTPVQVVQAVSDDLAKAIDGHQQEVAQVDACAQDAGRRKLGDNFR